MAERMDQELKALKDELATLNRCASVGIDQVDIRVRSAFRDKGMFPFKRFDLYPGQTQDGTPLRFELSEFSEEGFIQLFHLIEASLDDFRQNVQIAKTRIEIRIAEIENGK
jgi:hypothetical protein